MAKRIRSGSAGAEEAGTVVFNVGGRHYEVLRQTIEARPSALLASLLDDIGTDSAQPIFVDANPDRFAYILDWYRYGEIHLPADYPVMALLNDARFFLLPDSVNINGSPHGLRPALEDDHLRGAAISSVTKEWPTFEQYVTELIAEVRNELEALSERAKSVRDDVHWYQCGVDTKQRFTLSEYVSDRGQIWRDHQNVCNEERLRVLVAELERRGFKCEVEGSGEYHSPLVLSVDLRGGKLWDACSGSGRAQFDGVEVARGRAAQVEC